MEKIQITRQMLNQGIQGRIHLREIDRFNKAVDTTYIIAATICRSSLTIEPNTIQETCRLNTSNSISMYNNRLKVAIIATCSCYGTTI